MKPRQALICAAAALLTTGVSAGVLGRYELAQPVFEENLLPPLAEVLGARGETLYGRNPSLSAEDLETAAVAAAERDAALAERELMLADRALGTPSSGSDLVNEKRIVGTIGCSGFSYSGTLKLASSSTGRRTNAAFEGVRNQDGQLMLDVGHSEVSAPAQTFRFDACSSDFMNLHRTDDKAATVWYGHLRWTQSPHHCVSAKQLAQSTTRLVNDKCSYSDDSSQMLQYWALTRQAVDGGFAYQLAFVGKPQTDGSDDGDFRGSYTVGRRTLASNGSGTHYVELKYNADDDSAQGAYSLQLS